MGILYSPQNEKDEEVTFLLFVTLLVYFVILFSASFLDAACHAHKRSGL